MPCFPLQIWLVFIIIIPFIVLNLLIYEHVRTYAPPYMRKSEDRWRESLSPMWIPELELGTSKIDSKCLYLLSIAKFLITRTLVSWAWLESSYSGFKNHYLGCCTLSPQWLNEQANGASRQLRISLNNTEMMWLRKCRDKASGTGWEQLTDCQVAMLG